MNHSVLKHIFPSTQACCHVWFVCIILPSLQNSICIVIAIIKLSNCWTQNNSHRQEVDSWHIIKLVWDVSIKDKNVENVKVWVLLGGLFSFCLVLSGCMMTQIYKTFQNDLQFVYPFHTSWWKQFFSNSILIQKFKSYENGTD